MYAQQIKFSNAEGVELSGSLELPVDKEPTHFAIFAHCFTCGKDLRAARNITRCLAQKGYGVLRFDFTGLGESGGDFSDSNFTSNLSDLKAAVEYLSINYKTPVLLIGHSLGGTAALRAGAELKEVRAMVSIGAPFDPAHATSLFTNKLEDIEEKGEAQVDIAGRQFTIKGQFLEDIHNEKLKGHLEKARGKSILILHSPQDNIVGIENARLIFEAAHHPKSFITLDGADHLLTKNEDSNYVGDVIAGWAARYLPAPDLNEELQTDHQVIARLDEGPFFTEILAGKHHIIADEPKDVGGQDMGPTPYELLTSGLGACTAMTVKMYASRKKWNLKEVKVHLDYSNQYVEDCEKCEEEDRKIEKVTRVLELHGELSAEERERLLQIANKCPVHKTLERAVSVETTLKENLGE